MIESVRTQIRYKRNKAFPVRSKLEVFRTGRRRWVCVVLDFYDQIVAVAKGRTQAEVLEKGAKKRDEHVEQLRQAIATNTVPKRNKWTSAWRYAPRKRIIKTVKILVDSLAESLLPTPHATCIRSYFGPDRLQAHAWS